MPIHLMTLQDFTKVELVGLIERAIELKKERKAGTVHQQLAGKTVGLFFEKPSTGTRVSFESAIYGLGGRVVLLSNRNKQSARPESLKDMSRVMSRYVDGMVVSTFRQDVIDEFADCASVPVINALTDLHNPCQILSDLMSVIEQKGSIENLHIGWLGDGNNMANSWIQAAAKIGFELTLACPEGYDPDAGIFTVSRSEASRPITLTRDPKRAVCSADVISVGVSAAGQFSSCRLNSALLGRAPANCVILCCLPSRGGKEIADEVLESEQCAAFEQAENKMHIHKAVLESFII